MAVSDSISTPVWPRVSTIVVHMTVLSSVTGSSEISTWVIEIGWQRGIKSGVLFAAIIPAVLAIPSTSPFMCALNYHLKGIRLHNNSAFGYRLSECNFLVTHIDHMGITSLIKMI